MVDKSYMLAQPSAPSALKRFVDLRAVPAAIDAAGAVELALDQVAIAARARPLMALGLALGVGSLLAALLGRRRAT